MHIPGRGPLHSNCYPIHGMFYFSKRDSQNIVLYFRESLTESFVLPWNNRYVFRISLLQLKYPAISIEAFRSHVIHQKNSGQKDSHPWKKGKSCLYSMYSMLPPFLLSPKHFSSVGENRLSLFLRLLTRNMKFSKAYISTFFFFPYCGTVEDLVRFICFF